MNKLRANVNIARTNAMRTRTDTRARRTPNSYFSSVRADNELLIARAALSAAESVVKEFDAKKTLT